MAKTNNTKKMVAMALAAAVTVTAVPVDAYAASSYSAKVARAQKKADAAKNKKQYVQINEALKEEVVKVTVSVEEGAKDEATFGAEEGTLVETPTTTEETKQQGSVIVETTDSKVTEGNGSMPEDMDYVASETAPSGSNDLIDEQFGAYGTPDEYLPNPEEGANQTGPALGADDSENQFELVGAGNTSQYRPLAVFTDKMNEEEKLERYGTEAYIPEGLNASYFNHYINQIKKDSAMEGSEYGADYLESIKVDGEYQYKDGYLWDPVNEKRVVKADLATVGPNGETYYLHRFDASGTYTKDWYDEEAGEWVENCDAPNKKGYNVVWSETLQFVLVDKETGQVVTTYGTELLPKFFDAEYKMGNLEDSEEFSDEAAAMIRAVAQSGYWGTAEGEGSLSAMKKMLEDSGNFTPDELNALTDGIALSATQMAIYAHAYEEFGLEYVDANYAYDPNATEAPSQVGAGTDTAYTNETLLFKVYEYLKNLDPVYAVDKEEGPTTADTIITAENFLKDGMDITVLEKVDDGNSNDKGDSYKVNLSFALVVTPAEDNKDQLKVTVVSGKEVLAEGIIAGEGQNMFADENGNYTFSGITMTEGNNTYSITMDGIQNLEKGVYLFSSDVDTKSGVGLPSKDMVGMAGGAHSVNVTQELSFSFEVNDEKVVVREKKHGNKKTNTETIEDEKVPMIEQPEIIEDEDVPMTDLPGFDFDEDPEVEDIEIADEDVPMADAPEAPAADAEDSVIAETGDSNHMTAGFGGMFAALAGMMMLKRRKEN